MLLIETRVGTSSIHGLGLFAVHPVPAGTPIWRLQPGFDLDLDPAFVAGLPPVAREHILHFAFFTGADSHAILSGDQARFMNHADAPNTGAPSGQSSDAVITVALGAIAADEELTCNYFTFDTDAPRKLGQRS